MPCQGAHARCRYYWDPELDGGHGDCCIRQAEIHGPIHLFTGINVRQLRACDPKVDAFIMYGHEYMGTSAVEVIRPVPLS